MIFTIRDLLLVTVIVALAVGWFLDRKQLEVDNQRALDKASRQSEKDRDTILRWEQEAERNHFLPTSQTPYRHIE